MKTLTKKDLYPISRWYLIPLAERISLLFCKLRISANAITYSGQFIGIVIMILISYKNLKFAGILMLLWWMFDHIDGFVARKTNTESKQGAFIDSFLGGIMWDFFHVIIVFVTNNYIWGIYYLVGNYFFMFSNMLYSQLKTTEPVHSPFQFKAKSVISFLDDTDVRIHFLVICCLCGSPVWSLIYNAIWFNIRWLMNQMRYTDNLKKKE